MNFNIEDTIRRRKSIRSYEKRPLSDADRDAVLSLIDELYAEDTPFPAKIQMR